MSNWLDEIHWNADGLVPAIAQDHKSGRILMMAWMNRESLQLTVDEGRAIMRDKDHPDHAKFHAGDQNVINKVNRLLTQG